ncbi:MAG TPA: hypothetical protein VG737_11450, partial [Cyclobacteriaceae bacterium]|nr:hypothetical protein [Cyclobacteriaceae bacterium]
MINFIDVIPLAGALLTILVMVGLAFRAQTVSTADYFLLFFLSICFFSLVHRFLTHSGYIAEYPHLLKVNHLLGILRPPLFFLYVYFAIHPTPRRSIVHGLHFLPFMALLGFLFPYLILRAGAKIDISHGEGADPSRLPPWYFYLGIVYSIVYLFLSIRIFLTASQIPNYLRPATSRWIRFLLAADGAFILGAILILLIPKPGDWELLAYHIMTFTMGIGCVVLVANMNKHITEVVRSKRSAPD